ncbi:pyrroline-5-carboxylate reductase [Bacteroides heparinolyticus]|uniref:pyrroline-5-carboxylate reductase n=1 Tax=Prevotella heparinolytica TaxID=28113 RepID=UPI0023F36048|nr:pyrroline-5-carboxylate reductase [Bacteroides heparinolyticus]MCI6213362.1 pyrroline-5-carboxylate reductase [Bacteroides heparinolyticus]
MKVAIIGAGNMGGAIARGMAKGSIVPAGNITVADPSQEKLDKLQAEHASLHVTTGNREAADKADMIILAVKPWLAEPVIKELQIASDALFVSVAAGITCEQLAEYIGNDRQTLFRLIPNTAISEMQSMTLISSHNASAEQEQLMLDIFNEMGLAMLLPEEKMAAATAMTSCGIAYVLKYIQAAMQAGIELGIYPKDGMKMVAQSVKGAAELILNNDTHPGVEIDKVCTPGGITIRGINELEHEGFTSAVIKAIKKSC